MSKIMKWMRHLGSTSSPSPSNTTPVAIAGPSDAPLRAIHESRWSPSTVKKQPGGGFTEQHILVVVFNATGCTDGPGLVRLLERETEWCESDVLLGREENTARFSCDGYVYAMDFISAGHLKSFPALYTSVGSQWHHINLVFAYEAASRQSWDEITANIDDIRGRCENGSVPFTTLLLAMGRPDAPIPEEAAAFARERGCLPAGYSPIDGRGVCTALASLVENAHAAGTRSTPDSRPFVDSSRLLHVLFNSVPGD
ncbi:hypothetical protein QBC47DRAFT_118931 [Echria macrotheca]|uniref:Uncharacterized protein n=1 Tax=Echria macrotheca TaxID=438768 RepID=A0AAJ0F4P4_9PEZI|nr:hypothetical protein QBC47DRAFT_118931 [Echria macrotheca]